MTPRSGDSRAQGRWTQLTRAMNVLRRRLLTVSIQGTTLRLLFSDGRRVVKWVNLPFNPALLHNGFIANTSAMAQVISNALATNKMPPAPISAAFPGFQGVCRTLRLPRVRGIRPEQVVPGEARRLMGFSERQHNLVWKPVSSASTDSKFVAIAVPRAPLQVFIETLQLAGLPLSHVELSPLALMRAVSQGDAIIASVESNSIDIVIVVDSTPMVVRSLFLAEELLNSDSAPSRLAEELVRTLSFYNDANPENRLGPQLPIYIAGAFAGEELSAVLTRETGRPVMDIIPRLTAPEDFPMGAMAANMGLAMRR